jgi:hypothetical protein
MPVIKTQTNARLVRQGLEDLKREIPRVGRARMYGALFRVMQRMKKAGKRMTYPVKWASIRQRKKVMALLRKNNNLPYRRTGVYQKAYRIRRLPQGHELSNPLSRAKFIGGDARGNRQARMHQGRWPVLRDEVDKELQKLPSAVVEHLKLVARQKGFKAS